MKEFACCVLTGGLRPRQAELLRQTVDSIHEAGFSPAETIVCACRPLEYEEEIIAGGCRWARVDSGIWRDHMRALAALLSTDANVLLLFQDDVLVAKNLKGYLQDVLWPARQEQVACVSLYTAASFAQKHAKDKKGFVPVSPRRIRELKEALGVCAMAFTRHGAADLLVHLGAQHHEHGVGARIVRLLRQKRWADRNAMWWTHVPSLVQHVGERSTMHSFGLNDDRQAGEWVQDCRELL